MPYLVYKGSTIEFIIQIATFYPRECKTSRKLLLVWVMVCAAQFGHIYSGVHSRLKSLMRGFTDYQRMNDEARFTRQEIEPVVASELFLYNA